MERRFTLLVSLCFDHHFYPLYALRYPYSYHYKSLPPLFSSSQHVGIVNDFFLFFPPFSFRLVFAQSAPVGSPFLLQSIVSRSHFASMEGERGYKQHSIDFCLR